MLKNLRPYEKAIVYTLYVKNNHTLDLPLNDGIIRRLEYLKIICRIVNQCITDNPNNPRLPYMLQPWVIEKLQEDKNLNTLFKSQREQNKKSIEEAFEEIFS